jgi:outer membrane protein
LTLKEAEELALKRNPQISIGKLQALVSQQNVRESRSALMPNAYLSVTAADSHAGSRITAGALNNPIIFPRTASGVTVSQLITDFGRTNNLLASSEYQAKAEDMLAQATAAQIILAVDQAFFNALETKALVTVAQETVNTRQTFVDKIQALTGAKLKSDIDLSFANVDLARGRLLLLEAVNNYEAALNSLSAILGLSGPAKFSASRRNQRNRSARARREPPGHAGFATASRSPGLDRPGGRRGKIRQRRA